MNFKQILISNFLWITCFNLILIFKAENIKLLNLEIFILIEFLTLIMKEIKKIVHCKKIKSKKILTILVIIIMNLIHLIIF